MFRSKSGFAFACLCVALPAVAVAAPSGSSAVGDRLLCPASAHEYRTRFTFLTDGWAAMDGALVGTSPRYHSLAQTALDGFPDDPWTYFVVHPVNLWRYAVAGETEWADYTLSATVTIEQPAPLKGFRPGDFFYNYQWGREAIGSDAALLVRYHDPDHYYMVRLSSAYDHVELWKTHGGVVQVKPWRFEPKLAYRVSVTATGRWIIVTIDGKEIIRYADPVRPLRVGKVGFGVRESRVRFSDVQVTPAKRLHAPPPAHVPRFRLHKWVGRDYVFDGDEPIGFVFNGPSGWRLCEMKLAPGLMPMLTAFVGMQSYVHKADAQWKVTQEGAVFALTAKLKANDGAFACDAAWKLRHDPARGYVWDKRATLTMLKDKVLKAWPELDDPYFYQLVAPVTTKLPKCRAELNYCIKLTGDGTTAVYPIAQHEWVDALGGVDTSKLTIRPGGANVSTVDGWGVVCELPKDNDRSYTTGYCHWGMDQHLRETSRHVPVRGETYTGHVRYSLWDPARVRAELARGVLPPPRPNRTRWQTSPQLIAHTEPVNRCDTIYPGLTGESVRLWTGHYAVDHTTGRGDACSMRIDAAAITKRVDRPYRDERPNVWLGPSYWTGPYLAPRYRFGLWVKADRFTGKVVFLANGFNPSPGTKKPDDIRVELPIQGKCDWTRLSFEATFPRRVFNWVLRIDAIGTGTVWVDDLEVTPLAK